MIKLHEKGGTTVIDNAVTSTLLITHINIEPYSSTKMDKKLVNKTLTELAEAVRKCKQANGITREMIYSTIDSEFPKETGKKKEYSENSGQVKFGALTSNFNSQ